MPRLSRSFLLPAALFVGSFLTSPFASPFAFAGEPTTTAERPERHWHSSLRTAQAAAAETDRLLFVDLFADWCGWCRVLDEEVFESPAFDRLARELVLVRLDVEDRAEGSRTQARYGVSGLPTTLILDPSGVEVGRVTGVAEAAAYVARIERQIELHEQVVELYERVVASEGKGVPSERMFSLAKTFHQRRDGRRAAALYRLLEERGWVSPEGEGQLALRRADALRLAEDYDAAEQAIARARELVRGEGAEELSEAIDLLGIRIARESGDCSRRREALESFLQLHPDSAHRPQVASHLAALESGTDGTGCS